MLEFSILVLLNLIYIISKYLSVIYEDSSIIIIRY